MELKRTLSRDKSTSSLRITDIEKEPAIETIIKIIAVISILLFPMVLILCFRVVKQYKRAVILRFGRVRTDSPAGPGIIWVIPCTDDVHMIDLRTQSFKMPPQEILTKDSVTVTVAAVVYFHILKPLSCLLNIQNHIYATELITIATLKNILGQHTLYNLMTSRESISFNCRMEIDTTISEWGIVMERVEIKDIFLPYELQKAMAAEAEGTRIAKAKVIEAQGEIKAAENLKEASQIMMGNPQIMLLRYIQTLNYITSGQPTTVLFPFPMDIPGVDTVVRQFERAVILRNGKLRRNKPYGPGLIWHLPCIDTIKYTDLRIISYSVPAQEALTKDALTVSADAVVYYKIYQPVWAVLNVANYQLATQYLAATALRNALGTRKLSDILTNRPAVSCHVFEHMKNQTHDWGIRIVRVAVKDINLPLQLQKAMATEAESSRLANAKIIVAKSEIESIRSLEKATEMLMDNPYCMQLRYLQALQLVAGEETHTIVIPFAPDTIRKIFK